MAYFHLEGSNGNVRIHLKDIKDFRPTPPDLISINAEPIGTTLVMKDGREIDVNMSIDELRKHIRGWK